MRLLTVFYYYFIYAAPAMACRNDCASCFISVLFSDSFYTQKRGFSQRGGKKLRRRMAGAYYLTYLDYVTGIVLVMITVSLYVFVCVCSHCVYVCMSVCLYVCLDIPFQSTVPI
jgi:hypothetical protein